MLDVPNIVILLADDLGYGGKWSMMFNLCRFELLWTPNDRDTEYQHGNLSIIYYQYILVGKPRNEVYTILFWCSNLFSKSRISIDSTIDLSLINVGSLANSQWNLLRLWISTRHSISCFLYVVTTLYNIRSVVNRWLARLRNYHPKSIENSRVYICYHWKMVRDQQ